MLELHHVSKHYGAKPILRSLSLSFDRGSISLFLGHSGVGKSTLLRLLNGLEAADEGEMLLDGTPLLASPVGRRRVGMVFQSYCLFDHLTAMENLLLPLVVVAGVEQKAAEARARQLLADYNMGDKASHYPSQLSGGQKQRLAIARSACLEPAVLCMDEPTSALDPLHTRQVAEQIQRLSSLGYILLIATHDPSLIDLLDCTVFLMEAGAVIEQAPSEALRSEAASYPFLKDYLVGLR